MARPRKFKFAVELVIGLLAVMVAAICYLLYVDQKNGEQQVLASAIEQQKSTSVRLASLKPAERNFSANVEREVYQHLAACRVQQVQDGDTFLCVDSNSNRRLKVRLFGIAAPVSKQAYATQAKAALANLLQGKTVHYAQMFVDDYGRLASVVYVDSMNVNLMMLVNGNAQVDTRYNNRADYLAAESLARENFQGLWNKHYWDYNRPPTKPWEYVQRTK